MKLNLTKLIFCLHLFGLAICFNLFGMERKAGEQVEPKITAKTFSTLTLTEWARVCFKKYEEHTPTLTQLPAQKTAEEGKEQEEKQEQEAKYVIQADYSKSPILPKEVFEQIIKTFVKQFQASNFAQKNAWLDKAPPKDFFDLENNEGYFPDERASKEYSHPYVQKLIVPSGSTVFFIGDFHGSLHSLLRILFRFVAAGYLNDHFEIVKKNVYIIFNGDLVDRGRYSTEVLYTTLLLKLKNWGNVFLLRGNHEDRTLSNKYGLSKELEKKYGDVNRILHVFVCRAFEFFPLALYLGSGEDEGKKPYFVQCCHGGIEIGFNPKAFLEAKDKKIFFHKLDEKKYDENMNGLKEIIDFDHINKGFEDGKDLKKKFAGFNWSDFEQATTKGKIRFNIKRKVGFLADKDATLSYLKHNNNVIRAFFRGHQDMTHVFKMLYEDEKAPLETVMKENEICENPEEFGLFQRSCYPRGPYDWKDVVSPADQEEKEGFLISKYVPVFTTTTAAEGRGLSHEGYLELKTAQNYDTWRLKPHEFKLEPQRNDRYVQLVYEKNPEDEHLSISVKFSEAPAENPIPVTLIEKARTARALTLEEERAAKTKPSTEVKIERPKKEKPLGPQKKAAKEKTIQTGFLGKIKQNNQEVGAPASEKDKLSAGYDPHNTFEDKEIVIIKKSMGPIGPKGKIVYVHVYARIIVIKNENLQGIYRVST